MDREVRREKEESAQHSHTQAKFFLLWSIVKLLLRLWQL